MNCGNEADMIADSFLNNVRNTVSVNNVFVIAAVYVVSIHSFIHFIHSFVSLIMPPTIIAAVYVVSIHSFHFIHLLVSLIMPPAIIAAVYVVSVIQTKRNCSCDYYLNSYLRIFNYILTKTLCRHAKF